MPQTVPARGRKRKFKMMTHVTKTVCYFQPTFYGLLKVSDFAHSFTVYLLTLYPVILLRRGSHLSFLPQGWIVMSQIGPLGPSTDR